LLSISDAVSTKTFSKYNGVRPLPEDLQNECVKWFALLSEGEKKQMTLFLTRDAAKKFPGQEIESLTKDELYWLPCYGKFVTKILGNHSLFTAVGGTIGNLCPIKSTGAYGLHNLLMDPSQKWPTILE
jgi:hypothetical protein